MGAWHKFNKTPASIALASGAGIAATARPNGRHMPAITISAPLIRNAPTATGNPPSGIAEDASSAAPGVDQAMLIGSRRQRLNRIAQRPIAIDSAMSPDAACAGDAPIAVSPFRTTANDDANPTKAARTPARKACVDTSAMGDGHGLADGFGSLEYVAREVIKSEEIVDYSQKENLAEKFARRLGAGAAGSLAEFALRYSPSLLR